MVELEKNHATWMEDRRIRGLLHDVSDAILDEIDRLQSLSKTATREEFAAAKKAAEKAAVKKAFEIYPEAGRIMQSTLLLSDLVGPIDKGI